MDKGIKAASVWGWDKDYKQAFHSRELGEDGGESSVGKQAQM